MIALFLRMKKTGQRGSRCHMSKDHNDRIAELFAAGSRDLTPASMRHAAVVLYAPVSRDPEVTRLCASVLSDTELTRADRFVSEFDKARFKQRRAFRRLCGAMVLQWSQPLSQIVFHVTEKGRPYLSHLPDVRFSFSSCRYGFLGAWSPTHGIGVDIEAQTRNPEAVELAHRFFSRAEADAVEKAGGLERLRTFFRFWCLKEAALKSIGEGLPLGLDAFQFELDPNPRVVHAPLGHGGPEQFDAHVIKGSDRYCAALVMRKPGMMVS
jgi:phosphopantetheinyl transferase